MTSSYPAPTPGSNLCLYSTGDSEPRDIIPRASPSRPNSNYWSPPTTPTSTHHTSAISALKSLSRYYESKHFVSEPGKLPLIDIRWRVWWLELRSASTLAEARWLLKAGYGPSNTNLRSIIPSA
ncbi:hypothetical protein DL766_005563 [Monosporascus sp. MC13-8B]|uniref:Uncharacterized protein n=1 Tax=Monosporascus cannonballus TaxID=155416 RepID=A0ABY0H410_9PEZI|nr:hypothetical protein DL763_009930 [Monosporascus cannonballus]RYO81175.1 hypothetical protein DL762_007275 [Monosporascus cannonballus]RYP29036.1 hypothetical protein DL766_005563 [Monosporascus sp. MC13-8B]